jgi:hypothetical protein
MDRGFPSGKEMRGKTCLLTFWGVEEISVIATADSRALEIKEKKRGSGLHISQSCNSF